MRTRQAWLDLLRGLAIVSMLVAHTAPAGGIFNVSEYLTAPLFAAVLGAGVWLSWRHWRGGRAAFLAAQSVRGAILFGMGVLLQPVYLQIVVVLQWLGFVTVAAAVAVVAGVRGRPALIWGMGILAVSPALMAAGRGVPADWAVVRQIVWFLVAGHPYRALPLAGFALIGVGMFAVLEGPHPRRPALVATVMGAVVAPAAVVAGRVSGVGADPYSGTYFDLAACLGTVVGAFGAVRWMTDVLGERAGWLEPLAATGRMAMTAYAMQLVILRVLTRVFLGGGRDDHWWVLGATTALIVVACTLWDHRLGRGPLERLLRIHLPLFRPPVPPGAQSSGA